ncbi:universal stress protein YxiE [Aplysia californica]|uniref:Universal stress protein YxiE n=1 Tax=Aplysia californica TaxID=6500 RepID=A0ABM0JNI5_APLCA|nr:universal stress protein YxiE [Aplysia californica]
MAASHARHCIIAVDGSEHSEYAFEWYCKFIYKDDDEVTLLNIPEVNPTVHSKSPNVALVAPEIMVAMARQEHDKINAEMQKFADKLKQHKIGGKVKTIVASKPGEGIIKAAEETHADLIVLGSRGKGTVRRTLMGSVSDYVVHHAHVPVIVCKHPHKHVHPEDLGS